MSAIHPLARKELAAIDLPRPISNYRHDLTERLFTNRFASDLSQYPCPLPIDLQQRYAGIINDRNAEAGIGPDNILFTSGSFVGIDLLIRAFCSPNQNSICIITPTFGGYKHFAHINLINVVEVPLLGDNYDQADINRIPFDTTRIIFLCVPNNPTGTCLHSHFVKDVLAEAQGLVVIDEAYIELSDNLSWVSSLKQYPNLVILRTFSKAWGLAGIRAGVVIASPEIANTLRIIQDPFCLSAPAQRALKSAFQNTKKIDRSIIKIKEVRELLRQQLHKFSFIKKIYPSQTNFILIQVTDDFHKLMARISSCCLFESGPSDIPFSLKIAVGNDIETMELMAFLNQCEKTYA